MIDILINKTNRVLEKISQKTSWTPQSIQDVNEIPKGDMPGDIIKIGPKHIQKAQLIFPKMLELVIPVLEESPFKRAVIALCGGSGVGKSETASLLSYYLNQTGLGSYTLSGDNYFHRIPKYNDAERLRIYRHSGINGLISNGQYSVELRNKLKDLQESKNDTNPELIKDYPWLSTYQKAGKKGLKDYLGTIKEINFNELISIINKFKSGEPNIYLKRMGREETELWYDLLDFSDKNILIIEWTHGNNQNLQGVDIPILLSSTPQETLEHRKARKRDKEVDSSFTTTVLSLEQELLMSQASSAKLIISKDGDILSHKDYIRIMMQEWIAEANNE